MEAVTGEGEVSPAVPAPGRPRNIGGRPFLLEERFVSLRHPSSLEADQYRMLRCELDYLRRERSLAVVAVTSPGVGDGKTTTAINLAGTLAQDPRSRVLLVDADLRRPSVGRLLGFGEHAEGPGLAGALLDPGLSLASVTRERPGLNLWVLPAGPPRSLPFELLRSPRLGEVLAEARGRFDAVVVDTPPLLLLPDCRALADRVDGFLLVVAANRTPRRAVAAALGALEEEKTIGIVYNSDRRPPSSYARYYAHYYTAPAGPAPDRPAGRRWPWQS